MGIIEGVHHRRTFEDWLIDALKVAIVTLILFCIIMLAINVWIAEDNERVKKLTQNFYSLSTRGQLHYEPTERKLPTWGAEKKEHLIGTGHYSKKVQREGD